MPEPVRPIAKRTIWPVEASIWKNQDSYSVTLSKAYKDGDEWKHTETLYLDDLLKAAKALDNAHSWILTQEAKERQEQAERDRPGR
jgi:hypothetical protein